MKLYTKEHKYVCGIDLHARSLYLCILDEKKETVLHKNIRAEPDALLRAIRPYKEDLVIACECTFSWYWLADLCEENDITFILGHALYMKVIHGTKTKSDKIDSKKIALLIRAGMFPMAYVYPKEFRATRDLLRRRNYFMRKRAELLVHVTNTNSQYNLPAFEKKLKYAQNREGVVEAFADPSTQLSVSADIRTIAYYDELIRELELSVSHSARQHAPIQRQLLQTVPGIGRILSLNILYEIGDISRFERVQDFASYCRLIRPNKSSGGKNVGFGCRKIGNAHLRWSFGEAAAGFPRKNPTGKQIMDRLKKRYGDRTMGVLAHKLGRSVYYMLKRKEAFDVTRLMN